VPEDDRLLEFGKPNLFEAYGKPNLFDFGYYQHGWFIGRWEIVSKADIKTRKAITEEGFAMQCI
jgi:hypothetical protein